MASYDEILKVADLFAPELRAAIADALQRLQADLDVDAIVTMLEQGRITSAIFAGDEHTFERDLNTALSVIDKAFQAAGAAAATSIIAGTSHYAVHFNRTNPHAVQYAQDLAATMVTRIAGETRAAIRAIVATAFRDGHPIPLQARQIRPLIGLTDRQAIAVLNYRASLEGSGIRADRIDALVGRYARKKLTERAEMIARTETMAASNAGQDALWMQMRDAGLLNPAALRKWIVTDDDRLCPRCMAMVNQLVALDRPFGDPSTGATLRWPPLHPRCRCTVALYLPRARRAA
jgi:hypothetical protein